VASCSYWYRAVEALDKRPVKDQAVVFSYRCHARTPVSSACAWMENCSAGGRTAPPAAAAVPLPPAVWLQVAVTSIAHFLLVSRGVPGASFGLRLEIQTGVLVAILTICRQILCYWAC
jgi:hypothetical protein